MVDRHLRQCRSTAGTTGRCDENEARSKRKPKGLSRKNQARNEAIRNGSSSHTIHPTNRVRARTATRYQDACRIIGNGTSSGQTKSRARVLECTQWKRPKPTG